MNMFEYDQKGNLINFAKFRKVEIIQNGNTYSIIGIGDTFEAIIFENLPNEGSAKMKLFRLRENLNS